MRLQVNGQNVNLPSSLSEITLKQRIDFQNLHGNTLEKWLSKIMEIEDEIDRELELTHYQMDRMYKTVSFYLGTTEDAIKSSKFIDEIIDLYAGSLILLEEEEQNIIKKPEYEFSWNGEMWYLDQPELKNGSKITFGEFIDSKQIIQHMVGLSKSRWECLLPLCAIYLKKEGESYQKEFMFEGSERLKLMETLPLNIAMHVGFFLSNSLNMFINISQSSIHRGLKAPVNILKST